MASDPIYNFSGTGYITPGHTLSLKNENLDEKPLGTLNFLELMKKRSIKYLDAT